MAHTTVYDRTSIEKSTNKISKILVSLFDQRNKAFLIQADKIETAVLVKALMNTHFLDRLDTSILSLFLESCVKAEKVSPQGFDVTLDLLLKMTAGRRQDVINAVNDPSRLYERLRTDGVCEPRKRDLDTITAQLFQDDKLKIGAIFNHITSLVGSSGTVSIEKSASTQESLERVHGHVFDLAASIDVVAKFKEPRVVLIDGYVESVAEISSTLHFLAESLDPVLLFTRGMSDDVRHTLAVNYVRGSLRVVPFIVQLDINGVNTLKDLAMIASSDVVSTAKGDMISMVKFHECPKIESATILKNKIIVTNPKTRLTTLASVEKLQKMRLKQEIDQLAEVYDQRMKSLTSRHVIVRLRDDIDYVKRSQLLDYALRSLACLRQSGAINDPLPSMQGTYLTATFVSALKCAKSFNDALKSLGAVITS